MQSKSPHKRTLIAFAATVVALLALSAPAQAVEPPFSLKPGGFLTSITTNQAGAHPDLRTRFDITTNPDGSPASGTPKTVHIVVPKGLLGAPAAAPTCSIAEAVNSIEPCPAGTKVGIATVTVFFPPVNDGESPFIYTVTKPVYNVKPYPGEPAAFAFFPLFAVRIDTHIRADGDYGATVDVPNLTEAAPLLMSDLVLWGVPADHNGSGEIRKPFMTNPTECSGNPLTSSISLETWQLPTQFATGEYSLGNITGCEKLAFKPTISALPTTNLADSPSGLNFNLEIPQNEDPDGNATAHLKDASVTLPAGLAVNPSSANGREACSLAQVGISASGQSNGLPVNCPNASKLGSVEAISPSIDHPLPGALYLAEQNNNPFNSLLALYLVVEDPVSGINVKLAGKAEPDPSTGQLTVTFKNNPQLPVEKLNMSLFGGPRAALRTPATCGTYTANASITPWSGPIPVPSSSSFAIDHGPSGGACLPSGSAAPNNPTFTAGTLNPSAKAFSPFVLKLTRSDGSQPLKSIDTTLPKGLIGRIAGTPYCADSALAAAAGKSGKAEQASPSCPSASQVGSVNVGAGAGTTPVYTSGKAYLAGPYKGAPLSLAVITPAVAGPFDLGTVVIRNALNIDPETAQVHAVSDPIPTILQGIPLDIRSIALSLEKPEFTLNPTNCSAMQVLGGITSVFDQRASLSSPFQVGDCARLGFKPALAIKLKGGTKRGDYPALTATLNTRPGDANIATTVVSLPHSEFLAQNHIKTICTRVQFAAGAGNGAECPPASIYGEATAISPLIDGPLSGPAYLRSSSNPLPDLVIALHGQIDIAVVGRIDSKNGGIRTSFESVPDAPVARFVLKMAGGKKGLLENSRNLCNSTNKANVSMSGQNGVEQELAPVLTNSCKKAKGKKAKGKKGAGKLHKKG